MKKLIGTCLATAVMIVPVTPAIADECPALNKWKAWFDTVRRDYPVPAGNVDTQKKLIEQDCGPQPQE